MQQNPPLRVMTFNLRYANAEDGRNDWINRKTLVFDLIRKNKPDILGVQEALHTPQIVDLQEEFSSEYDWIGAGRDDGGVFGEFSAIFYKRERLHPAPNSAQTFWFSDTPHMPGSRSWGNNLPRVCTWGRFIDRAKNNFSMFWFFNLHIDHESAYSRERSAQLLRDRILNRMGDKDKEAVIVTGDFNALESENCIKNLTGDGLLTDVIHIATKEKKGRAGVKDALVGGTFNNFQLGNTSGARIDYILVSKGVGVEEVCIDRSSAAKDRYPSDHFPIVAALRW